MSAQEIIFKNKDIKREVPNFPKMLSCKLRKQQADGGIFKIRDDQTHKIIKQDGISSTFKTYYKTLRAEDKRNQRKSIHF